MKTYNFEIEGITKETLKEFIQICRNKDLSYIIEGQAYNSMYYAHCEHYHINDWNEEY